MSRLEYQLREATARDIYAITNLMLGQGPNQWNYLPEEWVRKHVGDIACRKTFAIVAMLNRRLVGAVTYEVGQHYPQYQPRKREGCPHGYIAELVVDSRHTGRGIGTELLRTAIIELGRVHDVKEVYAMRHADNAPSGRAMEKCGMKIVDEFDDPGIRPSGSRRTVVVRIFT